MPNCLFCKVCSCLAFLKFKFSYTDILSFFGSDFEVKILPPILEI